VKHEPAATRLVVLVLVAFALFLLAIDGESRIFVVLILLGIFAGAAIAAAGLMKALEYCWNQ
jgi:hypothetical protein